MAPFFTNGVPECVFSKQDKVISNSFAFHGCEFLLKMGDLGAGETLARYLCMHIGKIIDNFGPVA